jgi:TIR domain
MIGFRKQQLYDAFICHASEDKEDFVRPLAERLKQQHVDVWYDEFSLSIGDSLTQKIDEGLAKARFGIVVLSPSFFKKPWAKRELNGLTAREVFEKTDVILPVWHGVQIDDVVKFSPPLADKKAASTSGGLDAVLRELIKRIKPQESSLIVAKESLAAPKFDTPPISDEWWLDVIEFKEFLKFSDTNIGRR